MSHVDLSRGKENESSQAAFRWIEPTLNERQSEALRLVRESGDNGLTVKELARILAADEKGREYGINRCSGRLSELSQQGLIFQDESLARREGCRPWRKK